MNEFREVEDHLKEILDSGIAPAELSTEQILAECFDLYRDAKATVTANMPDNYRSQQTKSVRQVPPPTPPQPPAKPALGYGATTATATTSRAVQDGSKD